jgi:hypothetical protein
VWTLPHKRTGEILTTPVFACLNTRLGHQDVPPLGLCVHIHVRVCPCPTLHSIDPVGSGHLLSPPSLTSPSTSSCMWVFRPQPHAVDTAHPLSPQGPSCLPSFSKVLSCQAPGTGSTMAIFSQLLTSPGLSPPTLPVGSGKRHPGSMRYGIDLGHGTLGKSTGGLGLPLSSVLQVYGWAPQEAQTPGQINPSSCPRMESKRLHTDPHSRDSANTHSSTSSLLQKLAFRPLVAFSSSNKRR